MTSQFPSQPGSDAGKGKGEGAPPKFTGTCNYCEKVGHKWAECKMRLKDQGVSGIDLEADQAATSDTETGATQSDPGPSISQAPASSWQSAHDDEA